MKRRILLGSFALAAVAVAVAIFVVRPGAATAEITPEVREMIDQTAAATDLSVEELEAAYVAGLELADEAGAAGTMGTNLMYAIAESCVTGVPKFQNIVLLRACTGYLIDMKTSPVPSWSTTHMNLWISSDLCVAVETTSGTQYALQCEALK